MKKKIKIVLIGAGSIYTPELIEGLIKRKGLVDIGELALMDIDAEKLSIVGNFAARMVKYANLDWCVSFYYNLDCIKNADYVLTQIRVGRLNARINDEKIPLKYGLIGQETCGIGGFFKAYRTVPVMLNIVDIIKKTAPHAYLINFTNPSGLLSEALKDTGVKVFGLCNCPYSMEKSVKDMVKLPGAFVEFTGLNHFSWITKIEYSGKDYLKDAIEQGINSEAMKNVPANGFSKEVLKIAGGIPSTYLEYYYYRIDKLKKLSSETKSRGEVCKEIEADLLEKYKNEKLRVKPAELEKRGGAYYSEVAVNLIEAIENDRNNMHVINVKNNGTLNFLGRDDIIETKCVVGKNSAKPVKIENFNNGHIISMVKAMKDYEKAAVKAILSKNREDAVRALMLNPLCGDYNAVSKCYDELYELNRSYIERQL